MFDIYLNSKDSRLRATEPNNLEEVNDSTWLGGACRGVARLQGQNCIFNVDADASERARMDVLRFSDLRGAAAACLLSFERKKIAADSLTRV